MLLIVRSGSRFNHLLAAIAKKEIRKRSFSAANDGWIMGIFSEIMIFSDIFPIFSQYFPNIFPIFPNFHDGWIIGLLGNIGKISLVKQGIKMEY
jgi:hypothetical protein